MNDHIKLFSTQSSVTFGGAKKRSPALIANDFLLMTQFTIVQSITQRVNNDSKNFMWRSNLPSVRGEIGLFVPSGSLDHNRGEILFVLLPADWSQWKEPRLLFVISFIFPETFVCVQPSPQEKEEHFKWKTPAVCLLVGVVCCNVIGVQTTSQNVFVRVQGPIHRFFANRVMPMFFLMCN
jgi:hypothetical protein